MNKLRQMSVRTIGFVNSPHRKVGVRALCHLNPHLAVGATAVCLLVLASTGCISTGETIRVSGEVVDVDGQRVTDAVVLASASKRGGTIIQPGDWEGPDATDESRQATVDLPGDGTFVASANWSGTLTVAVVGYKIRRVDDLDTVFLVPNRSFFKSQDQVRLEVVKDE